jgi:hypothetical protein
MELPQRMPSSRRAFKHMVRQLLLHLGPDHCAWFCHPMAEQSALEPLVPAVHPG